MKATEFCKFFEFTLYKERGYADEDYYEGKYNYKATDDQGVFHTRYVTDVTELADEFDSLLQDYVIDDLECQGFEPDIHENWYKQALTWCEENEEYKGTDIHQVIACLLNPDLIEDDTEEDYVDGTDGVLADIYVTLEPHGIEKWEA